MEPDGEIYGSSDNIFKDHNCVVLEKLVLSNFGLDEVFDRPLR